MAGRSANETVFDPPQKPAIPVVANMPKTNLIFYLLTGRPWECPGVVGRSRPGHRGASRAIIGENGRTGVEVEAQ